MSLRDLLKQTPWSQLSKKLSKAIQRPYHVGYFEPQMAEERKVRYVSGREGFLADGSAVAFYWFVDEEDGILVDAKFQVFGDSILIGLAEGTCELCLGKNYDQVRRMSAEVIEKHFRDRPDIPALPKEFLSHINLILAALDEAAEKCADLPLPQSYQTPLSHEPITGEPYPGWEEMETSKKMQVIEQVMNDEIRPYVEMDAGGVDLLSLSEEGELKIAYKGNCTSCFSAIGATLNTIQEILAAKVHPTIRVVPDMESLSENLTV
jgi:NifU-like protein